MLKVISYLKCIIMGLKDKVNSNPTLTQGELEMLLIIIKRSTFKGNEIEDLYKLTLKLQKLYVNTSK